jgi:1-acyl-sn-glycerol-3-phosphate acyltransferase
METPVVQGLIVANHRSYFDPIIMLNHRQTFPVGKRKWNHGHLLDIFVKYQSDFLLTEKTLKVDRTLAESTLSKTKDIQLLIFRQHMFYLLRLPLITAHLQWLLR